jgi:hypothetical protein
MTKQMFDPKLKINERVKRGSARAWRSSLGGTIDGTQATMSFGPPYIATL